MAMRIPVLLALALTSANLAAQVVPPPVQRQTPVTQEVPN